MPPAMAEIKSQSADKVLQEMNRMPLFMTNMDDTDGEGGENIALEALKALAYEGTRAEIAENFRQQGNECARAKLWTDAKEFYDKAIAALKGPHGKQDPDATGPGVIEVELDEVEEAKKEKVTEEACYVNRALCNLEKSEYILKSAFIRLRIRYEKSHVIMSIASYVALTTSVRKLPVLHSGLRTYTPHQFFKRQSLLPIRYSLLSARQAC
jgi:hypothetical protein